MLSRAPRQPSFQRVCLPLVAAACAQASFDISLTVPAAWTTLCNMPALGSPTPSEDDPTWVTHRFQTTPPMSSYLVGIVMGQLEHISGVTAQGIPVAVYTVPGRIGEAAFALSTAVGTLDYFSQYFGMPYMLPKLDLVAVPDFAFYAMENWGLIISEDKYLLVDDAKTSAAGKQVCIRGARWPCDLPTL